MKSWMRENRTSGSVRGSRQAFHKQIILKGVSRLSTRLKTMRDVGKNIREARQGRGLTQDELAERLFVSRQTVSNYELGRTRPDIDMLEKLAQVLETDLNTLLYSPPDREEKRRVLKKKLLRLLIAAGIGLGLLALYMYFYPIAMAYSGRTYDNRPKFLVAAFLRPLAWMGLGWALMQGLSCFTALTPFSGKAAKWVRAGLVTLLVFYLFSVVFVTAVLYIPCLNQITSGPFKGLYGMLFYMGMYTIRAPAAVLILGAALWLVGFAKDRGN